MPRTLKCHLAVEKDSDRLGGPHNQTTYIGMSKNDIATVIPNHNAKNESLCPGRFYEIQVLGTRTYEAFLPTVHNIKPKPDLFVTRV